MLHIYFYIIFMFCTLSSFAKSREYTFIHNPGCHNVKITDVQSTDTTTVVTMEYKSLPGTPIFLPSKFFLEDEACKRYHLLHINGAVLGKNLAPLSGILHFSIEFEKIPSKCMFFDLKSIQEDGNIICFWGIHSKRTRVPKAFEYHDNLVYRDNRFMGTDASVIKGHINNHSASSYGNNIYIQPFTFVGDEHDLYLHGVQLSANGDFEIKGKLDNPTWTYLTIKSHDIPIFVYPGDTLSVNIDICDSEYAVAYESVKGYDLMQNLLKADPQYVHVEREKKRGHKVYIEELESENDSILSEIKTLTGYFVWKYQLSELESHLLYLNLKGVIDNITMTRISANFRDLNKERSKDPFYLTDNEFLSFAYSNDVLRQLSFMQSINTDDYAYFMLPNKEATCNLKILPTISKTCHPNIDNLRIQIMERYTGKPLEPEWMKKAGF